MVVCILTLSVGQVCPNTSTKGCVNTKFWPVSCLKAQIGWMNKAGVLLHGRNKKTKTFLQIVFFFFFLCSNMCLLRLECVQRRSWNLTMAGFFFFFFIYLFQFQFPHVQFSLTYWCALGLKGGWWRLPVWRDAQNWKYCWNDSQFLWFKPLQPKQRGFTSITFQKPF